MTQIKMSTAVVAPRRYFSSWIQRFLYGEGNNAAQNHQIQALDWRSESKLKKEDQAVFEKRQEIADLFSSSNKNCFNDLTRPQILATCERVFSHPIPDTLLSSLKTAEDVKNYFTPVPDKSPSKEVPLIPSIQADNLPQNLSVQCVPVKVDKRPRRRIPFANYSDPRHAHFPPKQKVTKDWKGRPVRLKK